MPILVDEKVTEEVTVDTQAETQVEKPAEAPVTFNPEILGSQIDNIHFMGCLGYNKRLETVRIHGKDEKRPAVVGYEFEWHGEQPIEIFVDKLVAKHPKQTLLTTSQHPETRTVNPGDRFALTQAATTELLGREEFNGYANAPVISEVTGKPERVQLIVKSNTSGNILMSGAHLKHLNTKVSFVEGAKSDVQPIKNFIINMFDKVDASGLAIEGATLKDEYMESFSALVTSKSGRAVTASGNVVEANKPAIELSRLFRKYNA